MNTKTILCGLALAALAVSCAQEEEPVTPEERVPIKLTLDLNTKVTDTYFESGDAVGIYVVGYNGSNPGSLAASGNLYDNVKYSYTTSWTGEQVLYWPDKTTPADFYAYYPYGTPGSVTAYPFAVSSDQSSASAYKASDFVWGTAQGIAPTSSVVNIPTGHIMSNAVLFIKPGDGFTAESLASATVSVEIRNVMTNAYINLSSGTVTPTGSASGVTPYNEGTRYRAVIVPQTVAAGSDLITVTVNGTAYTLKKGFTFVSGKQHTFTVIVNKTGSGINIGIGDWENDGTDNGGDAE